MTDYTDIITRLEAAEADPRAELKADILRWQADREAVLRAAIGDALGTGTLAMLLASHGGGREVSDVSFEVWQDDQPVAWADGPLEAAWREACHYAAVYGQDGPVTIYKVTRTPIDLAQDKTN